MTPEEIIAMVDKKGDDMNEYEWSMFYSYVSNELGM